MDTFLDMRKFINDNKDIYKTLNNINKKLLEHDDKFNYIFSKLDKKEKLFYKVKSMTHILFYKYF